MIKINNNPKSIKNKRIKSKYLTKKVKLATTNYNKLILKPITNLDEKSIYQIVKNSLVMKYVGNRKPWTLSKVKKFISYNIEEDKLNLKDIRNYYSFKIIDSNKPKFILGIIEFHLFPELSISNNRYNKYENKYFLTIYLHAKSQGKGIGKKSINLLIKKIKVLKPELKQIFSMVDINNEKMNKFSEKHNFKLVDKSIKFHNKKFNIYKILIL